MAGLAIAVGTWASIMIMVNFVFGILIFREPVHDVWGTMASFLLLILGLVGMSKYSAPPPKTNHASEVVDETSAAIVGDETAKSPLEDPLTVEADGPFGEEHDSYFVLLGVPLTKRQCGILGAAMNGVFTGGSLIPLHYAKAEGYGGANYILSMAAGAFLSNCLLWVGFFLLSLGTHRTSFEMTLRSMPRWYFSQLWLPGFLAGVLLSFAMFGSIIAVSFLGQGVGNSLVQTKILVSGLWGIFYYKEISGTATITKWFLSAAIAITAIIWLSLERLLATGGESSAHL